MSEFHVYLSFPGTAHEAFSFYAKLFDAECAGRYTYADMAPAGVETPPEHAQLIAHAALNLGNLTLMATDSEKPVRSATAESNAFLFYQTKSRTDAQRVFEALAQGGTVISPLQDQPWGYNGRCIDRFGIAWEIFLDDSQGCEIGSTP